MGTLRVVNVLILALVTLAIPTSNGAIAQAVDYRIEGFGGWNGSVFSFEGEETIGRGNLSVDLDSVSLDGGAAYGASAWVDGWIGKNWSLGLQYLRLHTGGDASTTIRTPIGGPITAGADADITLDTLFINLAWRQNDGDLHPYIGGGLGIGRATVDISGLVAASLIGSAVRSVETEEFQGGIQGFVGLDYDIFDNLYVGASGRFYYIDGRPMGLDLQVLEYMILGHIGVRF
jgi:opacity protein-like surface antigen